jgi:HPt (histidine-containing phosphotransfer) domain-containing protein
MPAYAFAEVDIAMFEELADALGPDQLNEVAAVFLAEMDGHLRALMLAAATGDGPRIGKIAHAIKGSAGTLALSQVASAASELELQAARQGAQGAVASIESIREAFRVGRIRLETLVRGRSAATPGRVEAGAGRRVA